MQTIRRRVFSGLLFTILILSSLGGFIYASFERYRANTGWVTHTYIVISELDNILSSLKDVQSAQRGFIITGQPNYLTPYDVARPNIIQHFKKLRSLIVDNDAQVQRIDSLEVQVNERVRHAQEIIDTYKAEGREPAFALVSAGTGKREMDDIRELVGVMSAEELRLLDLRKHAAVSSAENTLYIGGFGIAICFLIMGTVFWLIDREIKQRKQTQNALQSALEHSREMATQMQIAARMVDYLQSCNGLDEAYRIIAEHMARLLPNTQGHVATYNNSRNIITNVGSWGDIIEGASQFLPDECWAMRRGSMHFVTPSGIEPHCKHVHDIPAGGVLCIPMHAHGEIHGMLCIKADRAGILAAEKNEQIRVVTEQASMTLANLRLQEKLRLQSISDPLTGLFNRRYMETTLDREFGRAERHELPLSVLILDIDHFKKFNDTWGHEAGDSVLVAFAKMLKQKTRAEDVVCRFGGEEFVILMPGANEDIAVQRAKDICDATREINISYKDQSLGHVTTSVGIAVFPTHGISPEYLLSNADSALYKAKNEGRDRAVVATAV